MGNLSSVCTDKGGSPDLETLFEVKHDKTFDCVVHPSFRSCLHLWRIYSDKDDESRIRDTPLRIAGLQKFDSRSCYIVLKVVNTQLHSNTSVLATPTSTGTLSSLINSSKEELTPKGLSLPFGFISFEPLTTSASLKKGILQHVLYLWNGKDSTDLTKAVALAKSLAIDKLLGSEEKALRLLFSDSQKIAFSELFSIGDFVQTSLDWNHLLYHLQTSPPSQFDFPPTEKILLPTVNKILPIPVFGSSNGLDKIGKTKSEEVKRPSKIPALSVPNRAATSNGLIPPLNVPKREDPDKSSLAITRPASNTFNSFGTRVPPIPKLGLMSGPVMPLIRIPSREHSPSSSPTTGAATTTVHQSGYVEDLRVSEKQRKEMKLKFFDVICSEITPEIYLGSQTVAMDNKKLKEKGITHVLNCAGAVCSNYYPSDFVYKTLYLGDGNQEDISCMFYDVIDFIDEAYNNKGKVFVHCQQGVSRSNAMTICYLMWKNGTGYKETHQMVKDIRGVSNPNTGFMWQLVAWERRLQGLERNKSRLYRILPHCKQAPDFIVMKQLEELKPTSLDPRGCYLLHTKACIYVWVGSECPAVLVAGAKKWAQRLHKYEKAPEQVVQANQGSEPIEFWQFMGGSPVEVKHTANGSIEYAISL